MTDDPRNSKGKGKKALDKPEAASPRVTPTGDVVPVANVQDKSNKFKDNGTHRSSTDSSTKSKDNAAKDSTSGPLSEAQAIRNVLRDLLNEMGVQRGSTTGAQDSTSDPSCSMNSNPPSTACNNQCPRMMILTLIMSVALMLKQLNITCQSRTRRRGSG